MNGNHLLESGWDCTGGTFTKIPDEVHLCKESMELTKAGTHFDSTGLEHGMDMCGFHRQDAWFVRKDLHGNKKRLMKAAKTGGLWLQD